MQPVSKVVQHRRLGHQQFEVLYVAVRFPEALGEYRGKTAKRIGLLCDAEGAVIKVSAVDGGDASMTASQSVPVTRQTKPLRSMYASTRFGSVIGLREVAQRKVFTTPP